MTTQSSTRVALVTGAASGLGKELAVQLADGGYAVVCVDYNAAGLKILQEEMANAGRSAICVQTNIAKQEEVAALMARVQAEYGHLDVVINNAGIIHPFAKVEQVGREFAERVFAVNFWGTTNMSMEALPLLRKGSSPLLVNVASIGAVVPTIGQGFYGASKAAIVQLTQTLAMELADEGIDVMLVLPGAMKTNIVENAPHAEGDETRAKMLKSFKSGGKYADGITTARDAARQVVTALKSRPRRLYVGIDAKLMGKMHTVAPALTTRLFAKAMKLNPVLKDALK